MAKVMFSPIVVSVSGKVADAVFARWKGRNYIRSRVIPADPKSAAQLIVRESMARAVSLWQSLYAKVKTAMDVYAAGYRMSGYNWMVGQNRKDEESHDSNAITPANPKIDGAATFTPTTGAAGIITLDWTGGTESADHKVTALHRKVEVGSELDAITLFEEDTTVWSAQTLSMTGLDTGELYRVWIINEDTTDDTYSISSGEEATAG
ncbi:hypothetical protein ES705_26429 [subsurface metagenome]